MRKLRFKNDPQVWVPIDNYNKLERDIKVLKRQVSVLMKDNWELRIKLKAHERENRKA